MYRFLNLQSRNYNFQPKIYCLFNMKKMETKYTCCLLILWLKSNVWRFKADKEIYLISYTIKVSFFNAMAE